MRALTFALALGCAGCSSVDSPPPAPRVVTREVTYEGGGASMRGYLVYDEARVGRRPGVLVVHEWWGSNEYTRVRARMLAALGYTALAVDMYGDGKQASHPNDAGKFATQAMADLPAAEARFRAAHDFLGAQEQTDASRIAAIGYCFGGGVVLHMARAGMPLSAVASFHGTLAAKQPAAPGAVRAKVLVCHGAADSMVPEQQVAAFEREMRDAGADFEVVRYPVAQHGFTNPDATALGQRFGIPIAYDETADHTSWSKLTMFLATAFAGIR